METDSLLKQPHEREVDLASSRSGTFHHTPINARRARFDGVTIGIHWATVLIVLALFATAWLYALAEEQHSDFTPFLLQIHRSLGVTVWAVTALRLAWRLTNASLPPFPPQMTTLHRAAVKLSEYALYALLLGQPVTGMLATLFGGRPFALFVWQIPQLISRNDMLRAAFHSSHELGAWTLATLIAGHAGMALFHHFVLRDDVLECMTPVIATTDAKRELANAHIVPTRAGE
jgi:superoxide oxidase